jgi:hypothetical protein
MYIKHDSHASANVTRPGKSRTVENKQTRSG